MTLVTEPRAAKRRARPFVPEVPSPPLPVISSTGRKVGLIATIALAYVLQFGIGVLSAVVVFVIRQDGELEVTEYTTSEFVLTMVFFAFVPFALSMLVVALYRRYAGWSWRELGVVARPRGWFERRVWWRSAVAYLVALWGSFVLMQLLSFLRGSGSYPESEGAEVARILAIVPQSLMAGIGEELLLVGFLVVALERLGAKPWTIYTVAVVLRLAFHMYYGPPALALIIWAVISVWLFRRTRLIMPLVIVHVLWDVNGLSAEWTPVVSGLVLLATLIAVIVTGIVHLVTRRQPDPEDAIPPSPPWQPVATAAAVPPGWYADPQDPIGWRWWDGQGWTGHASR